MKVTLSHNKPAHKAMFKFLTSLILLLISTHNVSTDQRIQENISKAIKNDYPGIQISIEQKNPFTVEGKDGNIIPDPTPTLEPTPKTEKGVSTLNSGQNTKVEAYNTKSGKNVGEVSSTATEHSNALIPCSQNPNNCSNGTVTPSPLPIPTISPTSKPIPTIVTPTPKGPFPTPICKYEGNISCRMIECADLKTEGIQNICGCPCVPPPIY